VISAWTVFAPLLRLFAWGALLLIGIVGVLGLVYFFMDLRSSK